MRKVKLSPGFMTALCAILAITLLQSFGASSAYVSPSLSSAVDLSNESRIVDSFVTDLGKFDKKCAELNKKATLTNTEVDPLQRVGDGLRNRLSGVQNALREIIRKLKAAGQWDDLDARVLARVRDPRSQALAREESFKRILEQFASQLSSNGNDIVSPIDSLRNKLKAQGRTSLSGERSSDLRIVRVAYDPAPVIAASFRCRFAWLRRGITTAVSSDGLPSIKSLDAVGCYCYDDQQACSAL